jgi:hypothetical protein
MVYRVFSSYQTDNPRIKNAIESWDRQNIINIPINNSELKRNLSGLPFLKDLLDVGYSKCKEDDDIILYTNVDIGLVEDFKDFPKENFFSVRKNVENIRKYNKSEIEIIKHQPVICADIFGITKKWYEENRDIIPDFIIGSPSWDLALLYMTDGIRLNNISFHVIHEAEWTKNYNKPLHAYNRKIFYTFLKSKGFDLSNIKNKQLTKLPIKILNIFKKSKGFDYLYY